MTRAHLFCIDQGVWTALSEEEVGATVAGLREIGLYSLPYNGSINVRIIRSPMFFTEAHDVHRSDEEGFVWDCVIVGRLGEPQPEFNLKLESSPVPFERMPPERDKHRLLFRHRMRETTGSAHKRSWWRDGLVAILASKGIEKVTRQNKRQRLGIGSNAHEYITTIKLFPSLERGTDQEARPGRPVRPHLRRGHIRNQHYGVGNLLVKRIWIDPVFVNADDDFLSTRTAYRIIH